jgi:F-type H+-transporting ATPase subunit b
MVLASSAATALAAGAAAGESHEEPISLFAGDLGNAIWTLLIFILVLVVLGKFAWRPILNGLQSRESFIRESLSAAKHEREESQKLLAQYTAKIEQAKVDASTLVDEGRRDGEETRRRILADAQHEAEAVMTRAKKDIELARDDAIKRLHDQSILLATTVAEKLIRRELTAQDRQGLLDESLAELQRAS